MQILSLVYSRTELGATLPHMGKVLLQFLKMGCCLNTRWWTKTRDLVILCVICIIRALWKWLCVSDFVCRLQYVDMRFASWYGLYHCNWQQCVDYWSVFTALEVPDSKSWAEMYKSGPEMHVVNFMVAFCVEVRISSPVRVFITALFSVSLCPFTHHHSPFLLVSPLFFPLLPLQFSLLLLFTLLMFIPPKLNYSVWKYK